MLPGSGRLADDACTATLLQLVSPLAIARLWPIGFLSIRRRLFEELSQLDQWLVDGLDPVSCILKIREVLVQCRYPSRIRFDRCQPRSRRTPASTSSSFEPNASSEGGLDEEVRPGKAYDGLVGDEPACVHYILV